jgi:hypothetical protein
MDIFKWTEKATNLGYTAVSKASEVLGAGVAATWAPRHTFFEAAATNDVILR